MPLDRSLNLLFSFKSKDFIERKRRSKLWLLLHAAVFIVLSFLLLLDEMSNWKIIIAIAGLGITHYLVDLIKINLKKEGLGSFLIDQAVHVLLILIAYLLLEPIGGYLNILNKTHLLINSPRLLIILSSLLLVTSVGSILIDNIISRFKSGISENKIGIESAGKYIGIVERLLIFTFILTGNLTAVGFIFTAKATILSLLTKYLLGYF